MDDTACRKRGSRPSWVKLNGRLLVSVRRIGSHCVADAVVPTADETRARES
jgi:hypothetical protein